MDNIKSQFKDKKLFDQAMTHRSWVNEHLGVRSSNERLEFLGDAILEFIVSQALFERFPKQEEGYLTALRANLVNTQNLSALANRLNLGRELLLSKGEEETGGRSNSSLLANTAEALIGAIFLDRGLEAAKAFIETNVLSQTQEKAEGPLKDAKSLLQEYIQAQGLPTPKYLVIQETGPDHNKQFVVEVLVNSQSWGRGTGKSKNQAEQDAAGKALDTCEKKRVANSSKMSIK